MNKCDIEVIKQYLIRDGMCDFDLGRLVLHRPMFYDVEFLNKQEFRDLTKLQIFLQQNTDILEF